MDINRFAQFQACLFPDGKTRWIVRMSLARKPGDRVTVRKRDGSYTSVVLVEVLDAMLDGKPVRGCWAFKAAEPMLQIRKPDVVSANANAAHAGVGASIPNYDLL